MQLYERTDSLGTAASVELTEAVRLQVLQKLSNLLADLLVIIATR